MYRMAKYFIFLLSAFCLLPACNRSVLDPEMPGRSDGQVVANPDGTLGLSGRLEIPDLGAVSTRALGGIPNYSDLDLHLLVFEQDDVASADDEVMYVLRQYDKLALKAPQPDGVHTGNSALVKYEISLEPTEKPAVIHLIATNQRDFEQAIIFGTEERVLTALYTDDNHEAYWQRLDLVTNIPSADQINPDNRDVDDPHKRYSEEAVGKANAIKEKLSHVPMIRNFCRVSVQLSDAAKRNFLLTGLFVLNTVNRGSVAPYVPSNPAGERFIADYFDYDGASGRYVGKDYDEISRKNHIGTLPNGAGLINKLDDVRTMSVSETGDVQPVYFYERPARVNSTERTYVILRGDYTDADGVKWENRFYKVDLGYTFVEGDPEEAVGEFLYYNLLRNFDYSITVRGVAGVGYGTLEEAARGAIYNNFSSSVEARTMTSVSDGEDMIFVNFTSYVFTRQNEKVKLSAQYRIDIDNDRGGVVRNDLLHYPKWEPGEVIRSLTTVEENNASSTDAWHTYEVTGGNPSNTLKQQVVYIYRGLKDAASGSFGLYRMITFFSHEPWSFENIDTFPDLWLSIDEIPDWSWSDEKREIGSGRDAELTLFFELPAGLPQAIFPLEFAIESDRQNIQNAYEGNAVVRSVSAGESLFATNPTIGVPTTSRIQYVKTVNWEDYFGGQSSEEEQFGTGSSIVRCRFRTITDLDHENIGSAEPDGGSRSITTLRVANKYFGRHVRNEATGTWDWLMYHEDGFKRTTTDFSRVWDFSQSNWDTILQKMESRYNINTRYNDYEIYTAGSPDYDGLFFIDGTEPVIVQKPTGTLRPPYSKDVEIDKPTLHSATENGVRYVRTTNVNDILRYKQSYTDGKAHTMEIDVVSMSTEEHTTTSGRETTTTDYNPKPAPPRIVFTSVKGGTVANPSDYDEYQDDESNMRHYIYRVAIPAGVTELNLDIMPPSSSPYMRFYKISVTPKKDD